METIINTIPGYRVYEYLLVLSPHEELWNRIMKVKKSFQRSINLNMQNGASRKLH